MSRYQLKLRTKHSLEGRGIELVCQKCRKEFEIGDYVESKKKKYGKPKMYHAECYENLFF